MASVSLEEHVSPKYLTILIDDFTSGEDGRCRPWPIQEMELVLKQVMHSPLKQKTKVQISKSESNNGIDFQKL